MTTATTLVVGAMPATQASDDNAALIGGIVGGIAAFALIVGLIAFIVTRNRRHKADRSQPANRQDVAMAPARASSSNYSYGPISSVQQASNVYDESFLRHSHTQNYDDAGVLTNNYGITKLTTTTNYDNPAVLS
jgi:hypothetical protein